MDTISQFRIMALCVKMSLHMLWIGICLGTAYVATFPFRYLYAKWKGIPFVDWFK